MLFYKQNPRIETFMKQTIQITFAAQEKTATFFGRDAAAVVRLRPTAYFRS